MVEISIIVPCYNEEKTIVSLLDALFHQTIDRSRLEVVIADGMSIDATRSLINQYQEQHPDLKIKIVDNPKRIIPAALNKALEVSSGEYIIRLDAHSIPAEDYIERCYAHLKNNDAENVGGVWDIQPGNNTIIARAISKAASHPLGVGGVAYRSDKALKGYVDTVPFGAYPSKIFTQIGTYDESLLSNEDYELNVRIRQSGGRILLDPAIKCVYFARCTFKSLAKQYWRYGYWKLKMLKRYPDTIRLRQAAPPLFVLWLLSLAILSIFTPLAALLFITTVLSYLFILGFSTMKIARKQTPMFRFWVGMVISIMAMHFSWGTAFLWSFFHSLFHRNGQKAS